MSKQSIKKAAAMERETARLACGDVLQTVHLFRRELGNSVTIEQIIRVSDYQAEEIRDAINYLITSEYLVDATARVDHGDKRRMNAVGITKTGIDLVRRTTDDPGVVFPGEDG